MKFWIISLVLWGLVCAGDTIAYSVVVISMGRPMRNYWPLSGYYVYWKHRKEIQERRNK